MPKYKVKTKDCQLIVRAKVSSGEKINERELDFFTRKFIRGLMKAKYVKKFGFTGIEYSGPVGISLSERLKKPVTKYDFFFIIEQIVDMVQKLQANSMSVNKMVWDVHNVYINETTREMHFMYLPLESIIEESDVMSFIESIIYSANFSGERNTDFISEFTYFIKGLKSFDAEMVERFVSKQDRSIVNTIKKHNVGQSGFMTNKQKDYYAHYDPDDEATGLLDMDEATGLLNEEEETGLLVEEGTTLLDEGYQVHFPTLVRVMTDENISVNKPVFRLGKERSYSDYFVTNNSAVSRSHADIIVRNQSYYVMDLNSKNKTYVNGQAIPVQQEIQIKDGDRIRLGNEEFVFYE